ncbi:MAG: NTF2-like N-terminal transpeptidase domain-containing protein, partial [Nocardioidaceae bacterium]
MRRPPTAAFRLTVAAVAAALLTGSCSLLDRGPSAEDAAERLASSLTRGDLTGVAFADGTAPQAQELLRSATSGLGQATRRVEVVDVDETDTAATATLGWSWTLPGTTRRWTYRSQARLVGPTGDDDTWRVGLGPTLVHPDLADGQRLVAERTRSDRGDILGAGGTPLVTERPVLRFGIDKASIAAGRQPTSARALAGVLDLTPAEYADRVAAAGPRALVEAIVLRTA